MIKICKCGDYLEVVYEEVDIGVGIQQHVVGVECAKCDAKYIMCDLCGNVPALEEHETWCDGFIKEEES